MLYCSQRKCVIIAQSSAFITYNTQLDSSVNKVSYVQQESKNYTSSHLIITRIVFLVFILLFFCYFARVIVALTVAARDPIAWSIVTYTIELVK